MSDDFLTGFVVGIAATLMAMFVFGVGFAIVRPWIQLTLTGGRCSLMQIIGMRLRGTPMSLLVEAYTSLLHSGEKVKLMEVESIYLANRPKIASAQDLIACVREFKQEEAKSKKNK